MSDLLQSGSFGAMIAGDQVEILVGPNKKRYRVHKDVICGAAEYFHKMFTNGFLETQEQAATLPEVSVPAFELFLECAYKEKINNFPGLTLGTLATEHVSNLIALYGFAEQHCINILQDYTMTAIISILAANNQTLYPQAVSKVYQCTPPGSPMRKFAVRTVHLALSTSIDQHPWTTQTINRMMKEEDDLSLDVLQSMRGFCGVPPSPVHLPVCTFHVHGEDDQCKFMIERPLGPVVNRD